MSLYDRVVWGAHRAYKLTLSPWFGRQCRFIPTCSDYAAQALTQHGLIRGGALAAWRLCRCHPFGGQGYDPVPPAPARRAGKKPKTDDPTDVSRRPGP